ncbi:MAG TPA: DUF481 domain-containing protein [Caulobacteraceae bacterium]|jgi:hypothetical protein
MRTLILALALACAGTAASADVVVLKNGDRITGKVVSEAGGKLVVTPDFDKADKVTISIDDVATFSTTGPVKLQLKDGSVINQPVAQGGAGVVVPAAVAGPIQLADIAAINPPPPETWTGSVAINGSYAHATTNTGNIGIAAGAIRTTPDDKIILAGAYNYGETSTHGFSTTNANNWFLSGEYDRFITHQIYAYVSERSEADHVNFLRLRLTPSGGLGYQWINQPDFHFSLQGGVAWIYQDYSTELEPTEKFGMRVGYRVDKSWDSGRLSIFHDLMLTPTFSGEFLLQGDAGVRMQLTKKMFSSITVNATYDNQPGAGAQELTTQLLFGLGYSF